MRDMQKMIAERVTDQIAETDLDLSEVETAHAVVDFMKNHYRQERLGSAWGYTPELALQAQVEQYLEDTFGVEPEARGA